MSNQNEQTKEKKDRSLLKGVLIGVGIGGTVGGVGGYFAARKKLLKKAKSDTLRAQRKAYEKGVREATEDAQKQFDEWYKENIIVVDSDEPGAIENAVKEHFQKASEVSVEKIEDRAEAAKRLQKDYDEAEKTLPTKEEMNSWDLGIDRDNDIETPTQAQTRSEERERYLDMVERYSAHPEDGPMHISRKEFEEETHLEKDWVTYYALDNVFASDQDADNKMDSFANFGVTNGNELFARMPEALMNDDPDITYIRNFGMNTVYEITRIQKSYESLRTGEAYFNGETDSDGGGGAV